MRMWVGVPFLLAVMMGGCGGSSFKGTLGGGTGTGPQPASGQPVVAAVSPASVVAGSPSFTLTVTGKNFAQGDTVQWDSFPLATTFVSSSKMTAVVPSDVLYESGSVSIIVQTPTPNPLNFGVTLGISPAPAPGTAGYTLTSVPVQANDMVWDAVSGRLYLSAARGDAAHPNALVALDPVTGQIDAVGSAGTGANRLAVSRDGAWLYAGMDQDGTVQRYALPGLTRDVSLALGVDPYGNTYQASALAVSTTNPATVAVATTSGGGADGAVAIYDGATPRAKTVIAAGGYPDPFVSLAWKPGDAALYGTRLNVAQTEVLEASAAGLTEGQASTTGGMGTVAYSSVTGEVYTADGQVLDPVSLAMIDRLPLNATGVYAGSSEALAVDDGLGIAYTAGTKLGGGGLVVEAFDLRQRSLLGSMIVPSLPDTPVKVVRWGQDGLALLTAGSSSAQGGNAVYLVSGAFVTNPTVQVQATAGKH